VNAVIANAVTQTLTVGFPSPGELSERWGGVRVGVVEIRKIGRTSPQPRLALTLADPPHRFAWGGSGAERPEIHNRLPIIET